MSDNQGSKTYQQVLEEARQTSTADTTTVALRNWAQDLAQRVKQDTGDIPFTSVSILEELLNALLREDQILPTHNLGFLVTTDRGLEPNDQEVLYNMIVGQYPTAAFNVKFVYLAALKKVYALYSMVPKNGNLR